MSPENVEILRRAYEAFARGDVESALAHASEETVTYRSDPDGTTYHGKEGWRKAVAEWTGGFTEWSMRPEEFIDAGDRVVVHERHTGRGEVSGARVVSDWWMVYTFDGGTVVRVEIYPRRADAFKAAKTPS